MLLFRRYFGASSRSYFVSLGTNVALLLLLIAVGAGISQLIADASLGLLALKALVMVAVTSGIACGV